VADLADRPDRVLERHVAQTTPSSSMRSTRSAPTLSKVGLAHVRVADDDVQAPVLLGVGVGLVAGVDDGRLRVVALETPSQMCSARWLTQ
jgi:hypothetical protein